ncbi:MAG: SAM-dependent chlorinase/fluorinase [Desulfurococcus sp.]|nr:SAM-dependent chlorinase/fluorinase [Desulfurococcus sp.]
MGGRLIVLASDFGYRDPYVGVMKGVIKSINPEAEVVDLTHGITRHSILEAAVILLVSAGYFPRDTIFVVVVDPGVGSSRRAIAVETSNYVLIGPDNGSLSLLALKDGVRRVFDISNSKYRLSSVSHTFHGRDIFAPVAAWISRGVPLEEIGVEVPASSLTVLKLSEPRIVNQDTVEASILYVDVYGNIMTNVDSMLAGRMGFKIGEKLEITVEPDTRGECTYTTSFSLVEPGKLACYMNSWGYLEIAVSMGDASRILGIEAGGRVTIRRLRGSSSPHV